VIPFKYSAFIPTLQQSIELTELTFFEYKNLVKIITNNNNDQIINFFDQLIKQHTNTDTKRLTFLDKLIILLTIRSVCILPDLELSVTNPTTKKIHNASFQLYEIIDKLANLNITDNTVNDVKIYNNGLLQVTFGLPSNLYVDTSQKNLLNVIKEINIKNTDIPLETENLIDTLPIAVFVDAKKHISNIEKQINSVALLDISINESSPDENITVPFTFLQNSIVDFLKLCYGKDLSSIYEFEYVLIHKLHLPYSLIESSTYAELTLYLSLYNKERSETEKNRKKSVPINSPMSSGIF